MIKSRVLVVLGLLLSAAPSCSSSEDGMEQQPNGSYSPAITHDEHSGHDGHDDCACMPSSTPVNKSGTRIRIGWDTITSDDGAHASLLLDRAWDTLLNSDCRWITSADGTYSRCIPYDALVHPAIKYYLDAGCTSLIMAVPNGSAPAYTSEPTGAATGFPYRFYKLGSGVTPTVFYAQSGTSCTATSTLPLPYKDYIFFTATPSAETDFAKGDRRIVYMP